MECSVNKCVWEGSDNNCNKKCNTLKTEKYTLQKMCGVKGTGNNNIRRF